MTDLEKPALWVDIYALQILFSQHEEPVYFCPVYGSVTTLMNNSHTAHPQLPLLSRLKHFQGVSDARMTTLKPLFTVVPIFALTATAFGYLAKDSTGSIVVSDDVMCKRLGTYNRENRLETMGITEFRLQSVLRVVGGDANKLSKQFIEGHCASKGLCIHKNVGDPPAELTLRQCPGCGLAVHEQCGYTYHDVSPILLHRTTCLMCFDKFGRALKGKEDPDYFGEESSTPGTGSPSKHTRASQPEADHPFPSRELVFPDSTRQPTFKQSKQRAAQEAIIDRQNPSYMYPKGASARPSHNGLEWWRDDDGSLQEDMIANLDLAASVPIESHVFSTQEMDYYTAAKREEEPALKKKSFRDIILSAIALKTHLQNISNPITDYEVVNLCCLLDRGRRFRVDTQYANKPQFSVFVHGYQLAPDMQLQSYSRSRSKEPPAKERQIFIYRDWFQKYLDWFDPELFKYIQAHTDGLKVTVLPHRLAAGDLSTYEIAGKEVHDKCLVPLQKMHKVVSTKDNFGVTERGGKLVPYCNDTYKSNTSLSQTVRIPSYNPTLTASCNPKGFEHVPVARMPTVNVPDHHIQIQGIRAETEKKGGEGVLRWMGLQGGKYVTLPTEWVELNFDPSVLAEAKLRNREEGRARKENRKFLTLMPGDSREDDPPTSIRHSKGLNYYYQGNYDNCVMGGLVNAVFWMLGPNESDQLLHNHSPTIDQFWLAFVKTVNHHLCEYELKKFNCIDILKADDTFPVVVQLRAGDKSETHAICI